MTKAGNVVRRIAEALGLIDRVDLEAARRIEEREREEAERRARNRRRNPDFYGVDLRDPMRGRRPPESEYRGIERWEARKPWLRW